jgi:hypothetical protein
MTVSLDTLYGLGCYLSCGHLDYYDGKKHQRLGQVDIHGVLTYADRKAAKLAEDMAMGAVTEAFDADPQSLRSWDGVPVNE